MLRIAAFIISLLLATKAVGPDEGWFIALAVLTGLSVFGFVFALPRLYFRLLGRLARAAVRFGGDAPPIYSNRPRRWRWLDEW